MSEDSTQKPGAGRRYNSGKNRLDLIPAWAMERVGEVFTKGAEKYDPNNWKNGMSWTGVAASLKRHLSDWEQCKDFDDEDGIVAHGAPWPQMPCSCLSITTFISFGR